ncbi:fad-dependent pyridine nucleotide-disulfide oxidoreductase [Diplodia corticola]|uniref:Fad-dependent pyridine nucleotide-disulfide oxidoreductase n=1 Tax=Diplodia corticola TaxID=236234 RepID=A0A1J9RXA7_9PEZI|nr:fad-dependent pyridine nucleotide-disulfide oxidoreductase [Diplodia corticola]OJD32983.1 fad-dependent pyridine nucleotide-disulfide oxidoreductase [Diplodia corticola]
MVYQDALDIVVLGASFAGLSVAHNLLKNVIPSLQTFDGAPKYRVVLVTPSSHLYWNMAAPRALVSAELVPLDTMFSPVIKGFSNYSPEEFAFVQGTAGLIDTAQRKVSITLTTRPNVVDTDQRGSTVSTPTEKPTARTKGSVFKTLTYHALIFATGSSADSPLLSLHGPHEKTLAALKDFHKRLRNANSIVVVGGGASGVETAGQLAVYFNSTPPKPILARLGLRRPADPLACDPPRRPKTITLVSGHGRLLPDLAPKLGRKAEAKLRRNHVHVLHNIRLIAATETTATTDGARRPAGQTACHLNNDTTITTDVFVACTGVKPNTSFLPSALVDAAGYVRTHPSTLRVVERAAGSSSTGPPRVYAIGDCAAYSKNRTGDVYDAVPVLAHNLRNDLLAHELRLQYPPAGEGTGLRDRLEELVDRHFSPDPTDTLLMPCTKRGGVGVLFDFGIPSALVHLLKGRDYRIGKAKGVVERGINPYGMGE